MIAIIDYDAGNMKSVEKAFQYLNEDAVITRDRKAILEADRVVLPGVGAFGDAMERLHSYDLVETIQDAVKSGKPFLGICLGLQLLFDSSEETPGVKGLGLLPGKILRIPAAEGLKIPHMGWNSITVNKNSRILKNIGSELMYILFTHIMLMRRTRVYFRIYRVRSKLDIAVEKDNVFATQFHPEKSGETGMTILKNFIAL